MAYYTEISITKQDVEDNIVTFEDYAKSDLDCSMVKHLHVVRDYVDKYVDLIVEATSESDDIDNIPEVNKNLLRDYLIYNIALLEKCYEFHNISNGKDSIYFAVLKNKDDLYTVQCFVGDHELKMVEVEFLEDLIMSLCAEFLEEYTRIHISDYARLELDKKNLAIISERLVRYIEDYADFIYNDIATSVHFRGIGIIVEVVDNLTYKFYSYEEEVVSVEDDYGDYMDE